MQKKISQLSQASSLSSSGAEMVPIVQNGVTKRTTAKKISDLFKTDSMFTEVKDNAADGATGVNLINNKIDNGTIVSKSMFKRGYLNVGESVAVESGVAKTLPNSWPRPTSGLLYILVFTVTFGANASGYRDVEVTAGSVTREVRVGASPSGATRVQLVMITTAGGADVKVMQNSGSTLNCTCQCDYFGYNDIPS